MNVLIVENSGRKAQNIIRFFKDMNHQCDQVFSVSSMRESVSKKMYDLIIIDLHIPEMPGEMILDDGGYRVINYLRKTSDYIYRPQKMITLSKYLTDEIILKLNALGVMGIKYDDEDNWKDILTQELQFIELLSIKKVDVLLITAVDIELQEVRRTFQNTKIDVIGDNSNYYFAEIINARKEQISIVICKSARMGPVSSTYLTTKAIKMFNPDCIIMIGVAGGNLKETNLGDIVIAKSALDYSSGSIEEDADKSGINFMADPDMISIHDSIAKVFENYKDNPELLYNLRRSCEMSEYTKDINLRLGVVASGPAVIKSEMFTNTYIKPHNRKYLAVDMETYGVYYAAKHLSNDNVSYISIKSICDGANVNKKDTDQMFCARIASLLAYHYIVNDFNKKI